MFTSHIYNTQLSLQQPDTGQNNNKIGHWELLLKYCNGSDGCNYGNDAQHCAHDQNPSLRAQTQDDDDDDDGGGGGDDQGQVKVTWGPGQKPLLVFQDSCLNP